LTVKVLLQDIKKLESEALIIGFYENVRPLKDLAGQLDWLLCGSLSRLILDRKVSGAIGDVALLTSRGKVPAQKLFLAGLGPREAVSPSSLQGAVRFALITAVKAGVTRAALEFLHPPGIPYESSVSALVKGISEAAREGAIEVSLVAPDAAAYEKIARLIGGQGAA
jgi:hypothetical protein